MHWISHSSEYIVHAFRFVSQQDELFDPGLLPRALAAALESLVLRPLS